MTIEKLLCKREIEIEGIIRKVAVLHNAPYFFNEKEPDFEERLIEYQNNYRDRKKDILRVHNIDNNDYNYVYQLVRDYSTPHRSGITQKDVAFIKCKLYEYMGV